MRTPRRLLAAAALASAGGVALLVACGGEGDDADALPPFLNDGGRIEETSAVVVDAGPSATALCQAYVRAFCERAEECGITTGTTCAATEALCPDYLFGVGSARTAADVVGCTATRRQQPCGEIAAGITPSCAAPGTLAAGAACNFLAQCASFRCANRGPGACGTCAAPSTDGGCTPSCEDGTAGSCVACGVNEECAAGACRPRVPAPELDAGAPCSADTRAGVCAAPLRCLASAAGDRTGSCQPAPPVGQPCLRDVRDATSVCATGHCGGALAGPETCVEAPGGEDTRCERNEDCEDALVCSLAGGLCVKPAADGSLCPIIPATTSARATCARTSLCRPVPAAGDLEGRCAPAVPEGGACSKGDDRCTTGTSCRATLLDDGGLGASICARGRARAALGEPCTSFADCAPNAVCSVDHLCALPVCR